MKISKHIRTAFDLKNTREFYDFSGKHFKLTINTKFIDYPLFMVAFTLLVIAMGL